MPRRKLEKRNIRSLRKTKRGSYMISLPIEVIRGFKWRQKQRLHIKVDKKKKRLIIEDLK